jgi:integrase
MTVLNTLLKQAVAWDVIDRMPCSIRLLPIPKPQAHFHDFEAYDRLVREAERLDRRTHLPVLLGGDAGLRCGEMMALTWGHIDLEKHQICVQRSEWKGHVIVPKGGQLR